MSTQSFDDSLFDQVLGTPSAQTILRLVAIWTDLSPKEIAHKTGFSDSQVYSTLAKLVQINVLVKAKRGLYHYSDDTFALSLRQAYIDRSISFINFSIYEIKSLLRSHKLDEAGSQYEKLISFFDPLLKSHFSHIMSSLSHSFLEAFDDVK